MCHISASNGRSTERGLHRVTISDAKHPDDNSARSLLISLHFKLAALERELQIAIQHYGITRRNKRKDGKKRAKDNAIN